MHHINKVYSKIDTIPSGSPVGGITPGCAVLEGGAFRGVYGEGVLDAFMLNGINLQTTVGVSAGAMNGLNYVSGNIGRSARVNLSYRHDRRYVGVRALRRNHGLIGFDFAFKTYDEIEPLNRERFNDPAHRFIAAVTDCSSGEQVFFENGKCGDIFRAIQASASMPYVSAMVKVDGGLYLDGGCSKKVPYEWALNEGFKRIVVVRTRALSFRKNNEVDKRALRVYHRHPEFAKSLSNSSIEYNRECDEMESLARAGRIFMISPSAVFDVDRLEGDMEKLGELYWLGYNDALKQMDALKEYLCI